MSCFTPGISIATPIGERPVEDLRPGDKVVTRDSGIQTIRSVSTRRLGFGALATAEYLKPVLVTQGALGGGLPERNMLVSPNHRVLANSEHSFVEYESHEALIAAKHLCNHREIRRVEVLGVTYIHIRFDRDQLVLANGCWTEAFNPSDRSFNGFGNAQRVELAEIMDDAAKVMTVQKGHELFAKRFDLSFFRH